MRGILVAAFLLGVVQADVEPDAAVAEAARWVEPRGCASGSFRSRARPIVTEIEDAWQLAFDSVEAPPVHWDGIGYIVAKAGGKPHLVAFDLASGKERARVLLRGFLKGSLLVWDQTAMLQPDEEQITGYRLSGKRLDIAWTFRGKADARPRAPLVHDNEIYCFLGSSLARIRPGASTPSWTTSLGDVGALAVYGGHVFVASFGLEWKAEGGEMISDLSLAVFRRADGVRVRDEKVCQAIHSNGPQELSVMIAGANVYVGTAWPLCAAKGRASHVIIPVTSADGNFTFGRGGLWTCEAPPAHHPTEGTLLLSEPREGSAAKGLEWCINKEGKFYTIADEKDQPECFRERVSPTVVGEVVYFGSWAADLDTGEILWQLPVKRATSAAVPADGLVLVVDEGRTLRAFRGRGKR